ncbi:hypothetical protein C8R46DRAFT_1278231, partial [Mycena filopes]
MNPGWNTSQQSAHALTPTRGTATSSHPRPPRIPTPHLPSEPSFLTYTFLSFGSTILNSILVGADDRPRFCVTTDDDITSGWTVVEDARLRARVAVITWDLPQPTLAMDELGWTMRTAEWLYLASDRTCRTMIAGGEQFSWRPNSTAIERSGETVLEVATSATQKGLLKALVISTVLLMSGRTID